MMLSRDQLDSLHYDRVGAVIDLNASLESAPILDLQLGLRGAHFPSKSGAGRMLSPTIALRLHTARRKLTPYLEIEGGPAFTGKLVRPRVGAAAGLDIVISRTLTLGPTIALEDVAQWNGQRQSSDAVFFSIGLALSYRRFFPEPSAPPPRKRPKVPEPTPPATEPSTDILALIERTLPSDTSRVELLAPVLFDVDSEVLQPIGIAMLHEVARMLHERTDILRVEVQGYTDQRGAIAHNEQLSERRAQAVVSWLVAHGIAPERLTVAAHGANAPVEAEASESAHQQNRRVVFRVVEVASP